MSELTQTIGFAASLYRQRAITGYTAHVLREPLAQLDTRRGRRDPTRSTGGCAGKDRSRRPGAATG
jgi:hypothetical protein